MKELVVVLANERSISVLGLNCFLCVLLSVFVIKKMIIKKSETMQKRKLFFKNR